MYCPIDKAELHWTTSSIMKLTKKLKYDQRETTIKRIIDHETYRNVNMVKGK